MSLARARLVNRRSRAHAQQQLSSLSIRARLLYASIALHSRVDGCALLSLLSSALVSIYASSSLAAAACTVTRTLHTQVCHLFCCSAAAAALPCARGGALITRRPLPPVQESLYVCVLYALSLYCRNDRARAHTYILLSLSLSTLVCSAASYSRTASRAARLASAQ